VGLRLAHRQGAEAAPIDARAETLSISALRTCSAIVHDKEGTISDVPLRIERPRSLMQVPGEAALFGCVRTEMSLKIN
jgi:hypothetical protein